MAFEAWRGITREELVAALVLGAAYFLYDAIVWFKLWLESDALARLVLLALFNDMAYALSLLLALVVADRIAGRDARRRGVYAAAVIISGAMVSIPLGMLWYAVFPAMAGAGAFWPISLNGFFSWLILGGAATFVYVDRRRARVSRQRMHAAELERAQAAKRTIESRLQALQARVEPQFLFNTLAQVRELYRVDASRGEQMLDELIAYLRAAMPKMRDTSSTVGQELDLVRAYLGIVRLRLGERLTFKIESSAAVNDVRMPPMMMLPLVDHTIAHGIAASQTNGEIRIHTAVVDGKVRLEIADSGVGFLPRNEDEAIGGIRERLAALFESEARLELREREGNTTEAVLEIPLEVAERPAP
jgi:hypothetical protein